MTETTAAAKTGTRASDAEREKTVAALHAALGEGRLDLPETEARVAEAYGSRYQHELPELLADLPTSAGGWADAGRPPSWQDLWAGVVWRVRTSVWDGPEGGPTPTAGQRRIALAVVVAALLWLLFFVVLGAVVV